jgi:signal transduction histidine kinase
VHAIVPVLLALAIAIQRDALVPPRWPALVAGLAALPWVLELVGVRPPRRWSAATVRLLYSAVVLGAVLALILSPVRVDVAPFFLVYLAATASLMAPPWTSAVTTAASIALLVSLDLAGEFDDIFVWVLGIVAAWLGGAVGAKQQKLIDELRAAQAQLAARAAADERQRIAREIHDVIAHSLAVTMLHLTGARMALHRDPEDTEAALLRAEQLGRQSLADIRRTVGLLGREATGVAPALPDAADIVPLVREFASAGLDVDLELSGDANTLAPGTGLGLYRIAQESLANVGKHAPGAKASVQLSVGNGTARLRVWNEVQAPTRQPADLDGHGIRGMQERAALLGGTLHAGPCTDGWCVEVNLPRDLEPA